MRRKLKVFSDRRRGFVALGDVSEKSTAAENFYIIDLERLERGQRLTCARGSSKSNSIANFNIILADRADIATSSQFSYYPSKLQTGLRINKYHRQDPGASVYQSNYSNY